MTKLKPFQLEGVRAIYRFRGRALLADEQGLGKTIQSLYWIKKIPKHRPVVIIAPASMKYTWQVEASMHLGLRVEVLEGFRPKRMMKLPGEIVVLNYDILASWLPALRKANPQCVVIDECQFIQNHTSQRSKACKALCEGVPSVIGISGTPITNKPIEFWPILQIVRPNLFPSREQYAWKFCKPRYTPWGWRFDGASKLDILHRKLNRTCMIRRLKVEVLPELPSKVRRVVPFRLASYEEYHAAEKDFIKWLSAKSLVKAKRAKKSQALVKVGYLLRLAAQLKLDWTERWIQDFLDCNPGEKLVGFTMHQAVIDRLKKKFPDCVVINGKVKGRLRTETVRKFQSNKSVRLLLGNWKAASVGITLTAASNAAALDLPWTPGDTMQGEDRIHRIGQDKDVTFHYLIALGTIEEKLLKLLQKKGKILDAILNGERTMKDFDLFSALFKEIQK